MKKRTVEPVLNSFFRTKYIFSNKKSFDGLARKSSTEDISNYRTNNFIKKQSFLKKITIPRTMANFFVSNQNFQS